MQKLLLEYLLKQRLLVLHLNPNCDSEDLVNNPRISNNFPSYTKADSPNTIIWVGLCSRDLDHNEMLSSEVQSGCQSHLQGITCRFNAHSKLPYQAFRFLVQQNTIWVKYNMESLVKAYRQHHKTIEKGLVEQMNAIKEIRREIIHLPVKGMDCCHVY